MSHVILQYQFRKRPSSVKNCENKPQKQQKLHLLQQKTYLKETLWRPNAASHILLWRKILELRDLHIISEASLCDRHIFFDSSSYLRMANIWIKHHALNMLEGTHWYIWNYSGFAEVQWKSIKMLYDRSLTCSNCAWKSCWWLHITGFQQLLITPKTSRFYTAKI